MYYRRVTLQSYHKRICLAIARSSVIMTPYTSFNVGAPFNGYSYEGLGLDLRGSTHLDPHEKLKKGPPPGFIVQNVLEMICSSGLCPHTAYIVYTFVVHSKILSCVSIKSKVLAA